jgi:hypothetical protein
MHTSNTRRSPDRRRQCLFATLLLAAVMSLLSASPAAAQYPATSSDLAVRFDSTCEWQISGSGFDPGAAIDIHFSRMTAHYATVAADATGGFTFLLRIVSSVPHGRQTLSATGPNTVGGLHTLAARVVVPRGNCKNQGSALPGGLVDTFPRVPPADGPPLAAAAAVLIAVLMFGTRMGPIRVTARA